jgi:Fe-S oxidoreductase
MDYRLNFDFISFSDFSKITNQLVKIGIYDLMDLPYPYNDKDFEPPLTEPRPEWSEKYVTELDGYVAIDEPWKPKSKEEEEELIKKFLNGLRNLFDKQNNWTFLKPLIYSLENCKKCGVCKDSCQVYISSGRKEIYNPIYRSELLRKIVNKYIRKSKFAIKDRDFQLNASTILKLAELAYRCNICRRCTLSCPVGVDNALITREIRKIFSQEMGIAPRAIHEQGTIYQLVDGSSMGISPEGFKSLVEGIEKDIEEVTGKKYKLPVDIKGVDVLLVHGILDYILYPETVAAFAVIFDEAGIEWTLSSEMIGYDAVNYGVWYDDVQLARIALKHAEIARKLDVNRIVIGECGHGHSSLMVIADRFFTEEYDIPRESCLPILWDVVRRREVDLDPEKNNFPVTLHDPCNIVRLMGIVEPQRKILKEICPQFKEMTPNGVHNYCCGGGSGFAIMNSMNFPEFRAKIASRMKFKQILDVFQDQIEPDVQKYVCAPCSNCKGAIRDILTHYQATEKCGIYYGGLVELIVNAMVDVENKMVLSYV